MTATLVAKDLSGGHAHRTLFHDLSLTVAPGDVIGVVGANGAGKSTLLRLLAGVDAPLAGTVSTTPPDAFVGWLPQEHERVAGETVADHVARRTGSAWATTQMEAAAEQLGSGEPGADDRYAAAFDRWMASGAADLDERLPQVLADLGLPLDVGALMTGLSGGQAARVALAALLLSRFDVVLLDEPTNDLDLDGLARLETFVQGLRGGAVLVSHDREFLSRCVTTVVELDLAQDAVVLVDGGYEAYLDEREVRRRHAREDFEEFAATKADLTGRARRQREWSSQGVRNAMRRSPDNDKNRRAAQTESSEKQARKVRQMESRIARLTEVEEPRKEWRLQLTIGEAPRSSSVVATLRDAVVRHDDFVLGPVSLQVDAGDRIGVTGPNGAGKTTLLRALLGREDLDAGVRSWGSSVALGEVDQARTVLAGDPGRTLADAFEAEVPDVVTAEVRTLLAKFGLRGDHVTRPVGSLSPGERTRAALALLQAPRGQRAGARRADQPPRPAGHRAARGGPGRLPGHAAAGVARPPPARGRASSPAAGTSRAAPSARRDVLRLLADEPLGQLVGVDHHLREVAQAHVVVAGDSHQHVEGLVHGHPVPVPQDPLRGSDDVPGLQRRLQPRDLVREGEGGSGVRRVLVRHVDGVVAERPDRLRVQVERADGPSRGREAHAQARPDAEGVSHRSPRRPTGLGGHVVDAVGVVAPDGVDAGPSSSAYCASSASIATVPEEAGVVRVVPRRTVTPAQSQPGTVSTASPTMLERVWSTSGSAASAWSREPGRRTAGAGWIDMVRLRGLEDPEWRSRPGDCPPNVGPVGSGGDPTGHVRPRPIAVGGGRG